MAAKTAALAVILPTAFMMCILFLSGGALASLEFRRPRNEQALRELDDVVEGEAQHGDDDQRREDQRRVELRGGELDDVTEPLAGAGEFSDDRPDHAEGYRDLEPRHQVRQRMRDAHAHQE